MGNLQFWFDPNYGMTLGSSNEVLSWVSKSLNIYELTQSNINQSPIKIPNQIQEYSGIYFDGINIEIENVGVYLIDKINFSNS